MTPLKRLLEPKRALLAWQSSRSGSSRRRWAVAELTRANTTPAAPVVLRYSDPADLAGAEAEGFGGYAAFRQNTQVHSHEVLNTLMLRLPPRRRPDFKEYLAAHLIDPGAHFTDFALLVASEARLPSDGFSIVNPLDEVEAGGEFIIEAAGHRHLPAPPRPSIDEIVAFVPEPDNAVDPNAIAIKVAGRTIGYVNRLQTAAFHAWIQRACVTGRVGKINGSPDNPRVLIQVRVE